jgi:hypothetical protein
MLLSQAEDAALAHAQAALEQELHRVRADAARLCTLKQTLAAGTTVDAAVLSAG